MEDTLRELLQYAIEQLATTDDPYKRKKLDDGISLGRELLGVYDAIREKAIGISFGEQEIESILAALNPVAARYLGQILTLLGHGGLFGGGNNGRTSDNGPESEN